MINIPRTRIYLITIVFFALLLHFLFLPNPGFEADISFWKSWGLGVADGGIVWALHNTNNNYPTPFAYILGVVVKVYSLFADPHTFNQFWSNTNLTFLTIAKLPAVIADFVIAGMMIWIGKNAKRLGFPDIPITTYGLLIAFYILNPVSIIDGAWWGQVDSLGVMMFLFAMLALFTKRPFLAGVLYVASVMTKLQNMIYGPLFFLFIWQSMGYQGLVRSLLGSVIGFFGLNIEFFLARDMGRVIESLTTNYDYFPWMSLNAYNVWWIVAGGHGMQVSDKLLSVGIANAKTIGLLLFSGFYLLAMLRMIMEKEDPLIYRFLTGLIIVVSSFFLFQTQSHDRYAFPLIIFLILWAFFFLKQYRKKFKLFSVFYVLFSLLYFYNLHTSLVVNYPYNGLPILSFFTQPIATITASFILIALFLVFLATIIKRQHPLVYGLPIGIFILAIIMINKPLLLGTPISLTKFTPFISEQGYGTRTINMPINAGFGINKWTPLSVQYAFYRYGIGTHANSRMDFDIGKHFKKFLTDYGIDTEAGAKGTATFEIYGDGKKLFAGEKIGRFDLPRHIEVDISGVKTLGLVTTDAGDGINDDHTDWLNPLLVP